MKNRNIRRLRYLLKLSKPSISGTILILLLLLNNNLKAQCTLDKSHWTLVYDEEFNEPNTSALLSHGWHLGINTQPLETQECNGESNYNYNDLDQVNLIQTTTPPSGYPNDYAEFNITPQIPACTTCGTYPAQFKGIELSSTFKDFDQSINTSNNGFMYGMVEIRCKLNHASGAYPTFWLDGSDNWPPEIDGFEYHGGTNYFFSSDHWNVTGCPSPNYCGCSNYYEYPTYNLWDDFHTWTIVWTPKKITWFFDNVELKTDDKPEHLPGYVELYDTYGNPLPNPNYRQLFQWFCQQIVISNMALCGDTKTKYDPFTLDYVKIYKPAGYQNYYDYYNSYINPMYGYAYTDNQSCKEYYNYLVNLYNATPYESTSAWRKTVINTTSFTTVNCQGALKGCQGGGKFYYRGGSNYLYSTYWDPGTGGYLTSGVIGSAYSVDGNISLANDGDDVFYRHGSNIIECYWNSSTGSYATTSPWRSDVASDVLARDDNGLELYYKTTGNDIAYMTRSSVGGTWSSPSYLGNNNVKSDVLLNRYDYHDMYYIDNSNNVYWCDPSGGDKGGEVMTAGDAASDLAMSPSTTPDLLYRTSGNILKIMRSNGSPWTYYAPTTFMAHMWGAATATAVNNVKGDIVVSAQPANPQYYYVATDNSPWVIWYNGTDYTATPLMWTNEKNVASDFTPILLGTSPSTDNRFAYRGTDNKIRMIAYTNYCQNVDPPCQTYPDMTLERHANPDTTNIQAITNQQNSVINMDVYPNPTSSIAYLSVEGKYLSLNNDPIDHITLTSVDGRTENMPITVDGGKVKIDLSHMASGMYILRVYLKNSIKTLKVFKAND